jgi:predicted transcriptional regulator of viral defense system
VLAIGAQDRTVDGILAYLASRAHGVVTRGELAGAGVTRAEIERRLRNGALIRVHRGVFRVGHQSPSLEARYIAAVKACGEGSLLAGSAAAHLFGLLKRPPSSPEVLAPTQRRIKGVITHRARRSDLADATEWRGIPITTVQRTLVDLAAVLEEDQLARAVHEADVRHHTTPKQVEQFLSRRHNWPGARKLRRVLWGDAPVTLSRLESRFLHVLRAASLPQPETNRRADRHYVDCRWPEHHLTVELDSYRYHHSRHAWEQDREREREARARGDEFRRYTWLDVDEEPAPMLADLRQLLASQGTAPSGR